MAVWTEKKLANPFPNPDHNHDLSHKSISEFFYVQVMVASAEAELRGGDPAMPLQTYPSNFLWQKDTLLHQVHIILHNAGHPLSGA